MKQIFISENITDKHQFLNGGPCKLTKRLAETQIVHQWGGDVWFYFYLFFSQHPKAKRLQEVLL